MECFKTRNMGSPVEEEVDRYTRRVLGSKSTRPLKDILSLPADPWPFKELPLKRWKPLVERLLEILGSLDEKLFSEHGQREEIAGDDRMLLLAILRLLQRIFTDSREMSIMSITQQLVVFLYSIDIEVVVETYKTLIVSLTHDSNAYGLLKSHDILFRYARIDPTATDSMKVIGVEEPFSVDMSEESFEGESLAALQEGAVQHGRDRFVFEMMRRRSGKDAMETLWILGMCMLLGLARDLPGMPDALMERIDAEDLRRVVGREMDSNMEFAVLSLVEELLYDHYSFLKISSILQLGDENGFFYRKLAERLHSGVFEHHAVFSLYNELVEEEKFRYMKAGVVMDMVAAFKECPSDVRFYLLVALRSHVKNGDSGGISEFVSRNGMDLLVSYLRSVNEHDLHENANARFAFKTLHEMYMWDGRHALGIGNFEDSVFLEVVVESIERLHLVNVRLTSLCTDILTSFMFDEPLNFAAFAEKGAEVVLETLPSMELTLEHASAVISFIDAFSLNLGFQERASGERHLLKLLLMCREEELFGSGRGAERVSSLLNALVMHHPVFKQDVLQFYDMHAKYLRNLLGESCDPFREDRHCARIFGGFFRLVEQVQVLPEGDSAETFFDEISGLATQVSHPRNMQNFFMREFGEIYRCLYSEAVQGKEKPFGTLLQGTRDLAVLGGEMLQNGRLAGFSWESEEDGRRDIEDLMFSYDKQIALVSILCEEPAETAGNRMKADLFDALGSLYLLLIQLNGVFLSVADVLEHRFLARYKTVRLQLEMVGEKKMVRMHVLQSIYLCTCFLLLQMYPTMLGMYPERASRFMQQLLEICFLESRDEDDSAVLGLGFVERNDEMCLGEEHYRLLEREDFRKSFFRSGIRSKRARIIVWFFVTRLSSRIESNHRLRRHLLEYLRDAEGVNEVELSNDVIGAVNKVFGGCTVMTEDEEQMVLDIYRKFYTSSACIGLQIKGIVRAAKHTARLMEMRAFSSFQHFLKDDRKVYRHVCAMINKHFEFSDEFVELATHALLFATLNMCPHEIETESLGDRVPELLQSGVSFSTTLYFLTMYFRLLRFLGTPMPHVDFSELILRAETTNDANQIKIIFSYIMLRSTDAVLTGIPFPPRIRPADRSFLKLNAFLIYRDYDAFVRRCVGSIDAPERLYGVCCEDRGVADATNGMDIRIVRDILPLLRSSEHFNKAASHLTDILFADPSYLRVFDIQALDAIFEEYVRRVDVESSKDGGWAIALAFNCLYSEVRLFRMQKDEGGFFSRLLLDKIQNGIDEDFLFAAHLLSRTSERQFYILEQFGDRESTGEVFDEISVFLHELGILEKTVERIMAMDEGGQQYDACVRHSLKYLCCLLGQQHQSEVVLSPSRENEAETMEIFSHAEQSAYQEMLDAEMNMDTASNSSVFFVTDDSSASEDDIFEESSSQSSHVIPIKGAIGDCEVMAPVRTMLLEYQSFSQDVAKDIEDVLNKKLYMDLFNRDASVRGGRDHGMHCRLKDGDDESSSDRRDVWGFNFGDQDAENEAEPVSAEETDEEASEESELGSENGEMPGISVEMLNAMDGQERRETLDRYFDERRSQAMTYVPLNTRFYSELSEDARFVFEEMERVYREGFFYDIKEESERSVEEESPETVAVKMDPCLFERFLHRCMYLEEESVFKRAWRLVEALRRNRKNEEIAFRYLDAELGLIYAFAAETTLLDEHTAMMLGRILLLLQSIVNSASGYEWYFAEHPSVVRCVFGSLEKVHIGEELFGLVTAFSSVFMKDRLFAFDVRLDMSRICRFERFNHWPHSLEKFVENTASHFHLEFIDVILGRIENYLEDPVEDVSACSERQAVFLRLWSILATVLKKNGELEGRDVWLLRLLHHPFWDVQFRYMRERTSIEEVLGISDMFESLLIVGGVFEHVFGKCEDRFRTAYEKAAEALGIQINLLVEEQPERFSKSLDSFVRHSVLSFGNKRRYLMRRLQVGRVPSTGLFYSVCVDRENVLRTSYFQVMAKSPEEFRTQRMEVRIMGERGLDYGGVTREWFGLLVKDLVDPNLALFEFSAEDKTTVVPCRVSHLNPEHLSYFKFVGRIIAKAVLDNSLVNLHLSKFIYKYILGRSCGVEDVELADPDFHKSLVWVRDNRMDESLRLTFSFDEAVLGEHRIAELVENGADILVSEANKREYIELATKYRLFHGIELQLSAMRAGLYEILGENTLEMFNENELELLVCGVPDINVDDWKSNTLYYGFTESSRTVVWFWKAVKSLGAAERARLLQFATGTSMLPFEGFSHLQGSNGVQKFSIHRVSDKTDGLLPMAHTCFNQLVLPEYSSYASLVKHLMLAINECSTGFGFV